MDAFVLIFIIIMAGVMLTYSFLSDWVENQNPAPPKPAVSNNEWRLWFENVIKILVLPLVWGKDLWDAFMARPRSLQGILNRQFRDARQKTTRAGYWGHSGFAVLEAANACADILRPYVRTPGSRIPFDELLCFRLPIAKKRGMGKTTMAFLRYLQRSAARLVGTAEKKNGQKYLDLRTVARGRQTRLWEKEESTQESINSGEGDNRLIMD